MPGLIFLILPLSLLLVFALTALALGEVALGKVPAGTVRLSSGTTALMRRQLPLLEVASSLQQLTTNSAPPNEQAVCACESFIPLVTGPEAVAIAADLERRDSGEWKRVMERSRIHGRSCPMQTEGGYCACAVARPLACLGRCTLGADSPEWAAGLGDSVSAAFRHHLESQHVNASVRRLDEALVSLLDQS